MLHPSCLCELKADLMADKEGHCPVNMLRWISPLMGVWQLGLGEAGWKVTLANWHIFGCTLHYSHVGTIINPFLGTWQKWPHNPDPRSAPNLDNCRPARAVIGFNNSWQTDLTWCRSPETHERPFCRFVVVCYCCFYGFSSCLTIRCTFLWFQMSELLLFIPHDCVTTCSDRIIWAETMETGNICLDMYSNMANVLIYGGGYWICCELMALQETRSWWRSMFSLLLKNEGFGGMRACPAGLRRGFWVCWDWGGPEEIGFNAREEWHGKAQRKQSNEGHVADRQLWAHE